MPLIPTERLGYWTPSTHVGIIGGIPTTRTNLRNVVTEFGADNTGLTNASPEIQDAINDAAAEDIVYLPAGDYRIESTITVPYQKSNITFRGAGTESTILHGYADGYSGGYAFIVGSGAGENYRPVITGGKTRGSTSITVDDSTGFFANMLAEIRIQNDKTNLGIQSLQGRDVDLANGENDGMHRQIVYITAVSGNTLTLASPGLFDDFSSLDATIIDYANGSFPVLTTRVGFEDFALINEEPSSLAFARGVHVTQTSQFWMKNVKIEDVRNYPISLLGTYRTEIRHCFCNRQGTGGSNGAGILVNQTHSSLFEDNIVNETFPHFEINISSGNVFGYNLVREGPNGFNMNHNPYNTYNLYEGNCALQASRAFISDGYYGGSFRDTVFRNYAVPHAIYGFIWLKRFTREPSLVGNFFKSPSWIEYGYPNAGNSDFTGTAQLSMGDDWADSIWANWQPGTVSQSGLTVTATDSVFTADMVDLQWAVGTLDARGNMKLNRIDAYISPTSVTVHDVDSYSGVAFKICIQYGQYGFQEKDLDVEPTVVLKGNRYTDDDSFDSLGGDPLPDSLYLSEKPSWFGDLTWPPYDPVANRTPNVTDIPAGFRYINGSAPSSGGGDLTITAALVVTGLLTLGD